MANFNDDTHDLPDENDDEQPTPISPEEMIRQLAERIDQVLGGPTPELALKDMNYLAEHNDLELIGYATPDKPCCENEKSDIVGVLIGTEGHIVADRKFPDFYRVVIPAYSLHDGSRAITVIDVEAAKHLINILSTAVARVEERKGPDPLEKLWQS